MEIKLLEPKDASEYRKLRLDALRDHPEAFSSSYEEEIELPLEHTERRLSYEHFFTFGALIDHRLVGIVTLILDTNMKTKHKAHIVAMYVSPGSRGSGVGRGLMLKAIQKAKEIGGIEQIYLTVTSDDGPACRLYQSLGFTIYGIDKKGLKIEDTYFDEELMVLVIE